METQEQLPRLSSQRQLFAMHYAQGGTINDAVIKAGYSDKNPSSQGAQLLADPLVKAHIAHYRKSIAGELEITAKSVIGRMSLLADMAMREKQYAAARQSLKDILDWLTEIKEDKPVTTAAPANDDAEIAQEAKQRSQRLIDALTRKQ